MYQQIEKLKQEKEKLTVEYKNNQTEYKSEIKRINKAIRSFEKGVSELNGTAAAKAKRPKTSSGIEQILLKSGPLHIKELVAKLNEQGIPMKYQSVSGILQLYAKANKKFVKTAPATYALIEPNVVSELEASAETENAVKTHTTAKKKHLTKPKANANVQTNSNVNIGNEPENAPTETVAEKRTIVYEVEESEAGGSNNGEY